MRRSQTGLMQSLESLIPRVDVHRLLLSHASEFVHSIIDSFFHVIQTGRSKADESQLPRSPVVCVFRWEGFIMLISQVPHMSSLQSFVELFLFSFSDLLITADAKTYGSMKHSATLFIFFSNYSTCYFSVLISHNFPLASFTFVASLLWNHKHCLILIQPDACDGCPWRPLLHSLLLCQLTDHPPLDLHAMTWLQSLVGNPSSSVSE